MKCLLLVLFYHLVLSRVIVSVFAGGADDASSRLGVLFARTDTGRDFTPKKCARKNISLCEWCDGVVSRRTCRTFRTFDMFWKGFRTRRMKRAGACWTRERDSARFADGRNFLPQEGSVGKECFALAFLAFSRPFSLCLSHACVPGSFRSREEL